MDFDVSTNGLQSYPFERATVNCVDLFATATVALFGRAPLCYFTSTHRLTVALSSDASLVPYHGTADSSSTVVVRSDSELERTDIGASGGVSPEDLVFPGTTTDALPPLNAGLPTARLSAPSRVGPCFSSAVELSGALSSGFGGRPGTYLWTVDCPGVLLNVETSSHSQTVDMSGVPRNTTCTFALTVLNFLATISPTASSVRVTVLPLDEPSVSIVPGQIGDWQRHVVHDLFASVTFPDCPGSPDSASTSLELTWRVLDADSNEAFVPQLGTTGASLTLQSYEMQSESTYTFNLNVLDTTGSFSDFNESYTVFVAKAPVVTAIARVPQSGSPASVETLTPLSESGVTEQYVGSPLRLSGRLSYDLDLSPSERAALNASVEHQGWSFTWSCEFFGLAGSTITEALANTIPESAWTICPSQLFNMTEYTSIDVGFEANTLSDGTLYRVSLTGESSSRSDSTQAFIVARPNPVLQVSLAGPSQVTEFQVLRVRSSVSGPFTAPLTYQWSEVSHDIFAQASTAQRLRTSLEQPNLALDAGALQAGLQYTFILTVTDAIGSKGEAVLLVSVWTGPIISNFTATLVQEGEEQAQSSLLESSINNRKDELTLEVEGIGEELRSVYRLAVDAHYEGSEEDLTYRFSYALMSEDGASAGEEFVATRYQISPTVDVRLPGGDVRVFVRVLATGGAETSAEVDLKVAQVTDCSSHTEGLDLVKEYLRLKQLPQSLQILQLIASLLNRATYVASCVEPELDLLRNELFDLTARAWTLRNFHSLEEVQQLTQVVEALSQDTDHFSLTQVESALDFVDVTFAAIDSVLAETANGELRPTSARFALSVSRVLSHSLSADGLVNFDDSDSEAGELFCRTVQRIRALTARLLENEVAPLLVGEDAASVSSDNIVAQAVRAAAGGDPASAATEDSSVSLQVSPSQEGGAGGEYSVSVSRYGRVINRCFPTGETGILVSSVVDIDIIECESREDPQQECIFTADNVTFRIEVERGTVAEATCENDQLVEDVLVCSFWDETTQGWSDEGCMLVEMADDGGSAMCMCNHLTAFGIIKYVRTAADETCAAATTPLLFDGEQRLVGIVWIALFGVVGGVSLLQVARLTRYNSVVRSRRVLFTHAIVTVSALAQMMSIFFYTLRPSAIGVEISSAVQLAVHYVIFALVCQQWAKVYHKVLQRRTKWRDMMLNYSFHVGAAIVSVVLVAMVVLVAISDVDSDMFRTAIFAGSITTAFVGIVNALAFLIYGCLLINMVVQSARKSGLSNGRGQHRRSAGRIFRYAVLLVISFIAESMLVMVSVIRSDLFTDHFVFYQSLYLAFNLLSLITVIWLLWQLVSNAGQEFTEKKSMLSGTSNGGSRNYDDSRGRRYRRPSHSGSLPHESSTTRNQDTLQNTVAFMRPHSTALYAKVPSRTHTDPGGQEEAAGMGDTLDYPVAGNLLQPPVVGSPSPSLHGSPASMSRVPLTAESKTDSMSHDPPTAELAPTVYSEAVGSVQHVSPMHTPRRSPSAFSGYIVPAPPSPQPSAHTGHFLGVTSLQPSGSAACRDDSSTFTINSEDTRMSAGPGLDFFAHDSVDGDRS